MKKVKLLIIALSVSMMVMGVGYAAWSQNILINGNIQTGIFDIIFTDDYQIDGDKFVKTSAQLREDKRLMEVKAENMYPGAWFWLDFGVTNAGTVPAKLQDVKVTFNGKNPELQEHLNFYSWYEHYDSKMVWLDGGNIADFGSRNKLSDIGTFFKNNKNFVDMILKPGEFIYFDKPASGKQPEGDRFKRRCIMVELDNDTPKNLQSSEVNFTLEFTWKQAS